MTSPISVRQAAAGLTVLLACATAVALWRWHAWLTPNGLETLLAQHPWAPLAYLALHVVASLAFVPRTVMGIAAGLLFGLWWGIFWAVVGAMLGAWAGFALARLIGGDISRDARMPRLVAMVERLERSGWRTVWMIRLLPLPHTPLNYAFGLTRMDWTTYSIGSLLGVLPSTVLAVAVGTAGGKVFDGNAMSWVAPTAVGLLGLGASILLPRLRFLRSGD